jgi:hypothetical protein
MQLIQRFGFSALCSSIINFILLFSFSFATVSLLYLSQQHQAVAQTTVYPSINTNTNQVKPLNKTYKLTIGNKIFPVKYNIIGGNINNITSNGDQSTIIVGITASPGGGKFTVNLPRDLIDSKTSSGIDKNFRVFEDDESDPIPVSESNNNQSRILTISFDSDDDAIEIQGTVIASPTSSLEVHHNF